MTNKVTLLDGTRDDSLSGCSTFVRLLQPYVTENKCTEAGEHVQDDESIKVRLQFL